MISAGVPDPVELSSLAITKLYASACPAFDVDNDAETGCEASFSRDGEQGTSDLRLQRSSLLGIILHRWSAYTCRIRMSFAVALSAYAWAYVHIYIYDMYTHTCNRYFNYSLMLKKDLHWKIQAISSNTIL